MLHWVVMDVFNMAGEISFVSNDMLPKAALPDGLLFFLNLDGVIGGLNSLLQRLLKELLIRRHRFEKSLSVSGKVHIQ